MRYRSQVAIGKNGVLFSRDQTVMNLLKTTLMTKIGRKSEELSDATRIGVNSLRVCDWLLLLRRRRNLAMEPLDKTCTTERWFSKGLQWAPLLSLPLVSLRQHCQLLAGRELYK
jgi:hypothetical protein